MGSIEVASKNLQASHSIEQLSKKPKLDEESLSIHLENSSAPELDMSNHSDEDYGEDDADDYSDYYDDDNVYETEEDNYSKMQSQFDNVDLPPGVEISLPWLNDNASTTNLPSQPQTVTSNTTASIGLAVPTRSTVKPVASSSSAVLDEDKGVENLLEKLKQFQQFNTVEDFSDHHYIDAGLSGQKIPDKIWVRKIQEEWKILEANLPDTIYVRVCERRMDLLKAVITGPAGTPYHNGLFVFDAVFPPEYPNVPPMVYYYSGGLRLNPNLYECGKVCLSLLHTWSGKNSEMWIAGKSTMLQVLVSIQALILNSEPFYNEPGYECYKGKEGERKSSEYNDGVYILSLKTMIYTLRNPPKHFEDLVFGHFYERACEILEECKAYSEGAPVGSVVKYSLAVKGSSSSSSIKHSYDFTRSAHKMMKVLIKLFKKNGSKDLEQFDPPA